MEESKKNIQVRLRRIEGQIKGIEKMVENDACCKDVLIQITAVRAAVNKVGGIMLENYAKKCFNNNSGLKSNDDKVQELISTLIMFLK